MLPAYADSRGYVHVYCTHCHQWHHHGRMRGTGPDHWVEHCWHPGSPYQRGGYYLQVVGEYTPELTKSADEIDTRAGYWRLIVYALHRRGPRGPKVIADETGIPPGSISALLREMCAVGLLHQDGRGRPYELARADAGTPDRMAA